MLIGTKQTKIALQELSEIPDFHYDENMPQPGIVPTDYEEFFTDFGGITHDGKKDPKTGRPMAVKNLAWYQIQFAKLLFGIMLKCNKVGMTTSEMLADFHWLLQPEWAGSDVLLQAAKSEIANDLLLSLKIKILNSPKYKKYMIQSTEYLLKEQKTKIAALFIYNPYNPRKPSRILAVGSSMSGTFSRINITRLHISDPGTLIIKSQENFYAGMFSRLLNTGGSIKIEGVPSDDYSSWFYKICEIMFDFKKVSSHTPGAELLNDAEYEIPQTIKEVFTGMKITIEDAVEEGVILPEVRDRMKKIMSPAKYKMTCMAEFPPPRGAIFGGDFKTSDVRFDLLD